MKALETREQEKSVDAVECNPGLLFVGVRRATWSVMASMSSLGMIDGDMGFFASLAVGWVSPKLDGEFISNKGHAASHMTELYKSTIIIHWWVLRI